MNVKKGFVSLILILLLIPALFVSAFAAEAPEFRYELSIDGGESKEVETGDIITVTLHLVRTDADSPYTMYAMQDEIRYDGEFFRLVEDGALLSNGISSADISVMGGLREFYMNFVSFSGGSQWEPKTRVGSFQLEVIAENGVTTITNEDFLVSLPDGSGSYPCEANELTVILTTECVVRFETNGGTEIEDIIAVYGETLTRPEDPVREGKQFVGWYKDIHLSEPWDFASDIVKGSMTLYAKWEDVIVEETPAPVAPDEEGEDGCAIAGIPCWLWIILLIVILAIVVYFISHEKKKAKGKHVGKHTRKAE